MLQIIFQTNTKNVFQVYQNQFYKLINCQKLETSAAKKGLKKVNDDDAVDVGTWNPGHFGGMERLESEKTNGSIKPLKWSVLHNHLTKKWKFNLNIFMSFLHFILFITYYFFASCCRFRWLVNVYKSHPLFIVRRIHSFVVGKMINE